MGSFIHVRGPSVNRVNDEEGALVGRLQPHRHFLACAGPDHIVFRIKAGNSTANGRGRMTARKANALRIALGRR